MIYATLLGAPSVYSNDQAIRDAFKLAGLKSGQCVVDLGCGNAKSLIIAAKEFGAQGIGVERSPYCFLQAKFRVWQSSESKNIKIYFGNFSRLEKELRKADVVYLYLLNSILVKIESWLFSNLQPEAKVVSLAFEFLKRQPAQAAQTINLGRKTTIRLYLKKK